MLELYWGCLIGGILFAIVTIIFGDLLGDLIHSDYFDSTVISGGITTFGGAGVLLTRYTSLETWVVVVTALLIALCISMLTFFFYIKPMKNSENSTSFSIQDLVGGIGEVSIPVPAEGYGEVLMKIGAGMTNQIAASFDGEEIPAGTRIVVVEAKDDTLYVSRLEHI